MKAALIPRARKDGKCLVALDADGLVASSAVGRSLHQFVCHLDHFPARVQIIAESDEDSAQMAFSQADEDVHLFSLLCCWKLGWVDVWGKRCTANPDRLRVL